MTSSLFPSRLLLDLPNWVGDTVIGLPALDRLVTANAQGATVLHTRASMSRLLRLLFPTATVLTSPRRAFPLLVAHRLCREHGRFALGVTLRNATRAKIMLRLSSRRSYGSSSDGGTILLSHHFPIDRGCHQMYDLDPVLTGLGLEKVSADASLELPATCRTEGAAVLNRAGLTGARCVGLAPGVAHSEAKRWPASSYGAVAAMLVQAGLQPVLLIGPGEQTLAHEVLCHASAELPVLGENTDVAGLAGIIAHLAVVVGNDSGPIHLAALAGVATLALFGPTNPGRTAPVGFQHKVLAPSLACAPCNKPQCPSGHHECLAALSPSTVAASILDIEQRSHLM